MVMGVRLGYLAGKYISDVEIAEKDKKEEKAEFFLNEVELFSPFLRYNYFRDN